MGQSVISGLLLAWAVQVAASQGRSPLGTAAPISAQLTVAEDHLSFDVASVKPSRSDGEPYSNFPLGPGDVYVPNGGFFSATNQPLITYIFFAYKVKGNQAKYLRNELPGWVSTEQFDIQARAAGSRTKDQMRLMMRSLLADRFKVVIHHETRQVPVMAVVLAKPGKPGPELQPHPADSLCMSRSPAPSAPGQAQQPPQAAAGRLPALCGGIYYVQPSEPGRVSVGARNVMIAFILDSLSGVTVLDRPFSDQTGLSGTFDFTLEWTPELDRLPPPDVDFHPDPNGPTLQQAMREQLGLKLESQKGQVDVIVVDHVERPSGN